MQRIGLGVIGGGYMGKAHAVAANAVRAVFGFQADVHLAGVAASSPESAKRYAQAYGAAQAFDCAADLIASDQVDAVIIASPQDTHLEYALQASRLGKPILCEKPMGRSVQEAQAIADAGQSVINQVGYNYMSTPAAQHAEHLIREGRIGEVIWFRGEHHEDFLAVSGSNEWRKQGDANGTLGDLAPHVIHAAQRLCGPIEAVVADVRQRAQVRGEANTEHGNDDQAHALVKFASSANGMLSFSRVAIGRKMGLAFEVHGTQGALRFDQEDQNSLWFHDGTMGPDSGFTRILAGPPHGAYRHFCQGAGHGTGYQDQIIIEQGEFVSAMLQKRPAAPDFQQGVAVLKVVDALRRSQQQNAWVQIN